jgi:LysR family transcriptional activator of nhaA
MSGMEWLNYHHLLYFWVAAREGGVTAAAARLRLAPPTLSSQIRSLEDALGQKLFTRVGRRLELTETGRTVLRYADEIFGLGRELLDTVKGRPSGQPLPLVVGVADAVPKLIVRRLLEPALHLAEPVRLVCREDNPERLLAELAVHAIDLVVTDAPLGAGSAVKAFNHLLGECPVAFFGTPALAAAHRRGFPGSLDGAPVLLPGGHSALRRGLDQWLERAGVRPRVVAEFDDSALLKVFGQDGLGLFPGPAAITQEIVAQHGVQLVGQVDEVRARFFVVSAERRLKHPAVVAITDAARRSLFG